MSKGRRQLQSRVGRRRTYAVGIAVCAHALFVTALLWQGGARGPASIRPLDVQLVRLSPPSREPRATTRSIVRSIVPRRPEATTSTTEPPPNVLPTPQNSPQPQQIPAPPIGSALMAHLGCDLSGVAEETADQRQRCQERFAARQHAGGGTFAAVNPGQQAYFDASAKRALWWQQPFLAMEPKNGCRPRVTNQQAGIPGGRATTSDWRVGVGCAISF